MTAVPQLTPHRFYSAQEIAQMRGGKEVHKGEFQCKCPAHEDRVASLSVGTGRNGDTLIDCKAGCDKRDVVRALGLEWSNLFREARSNGQHSPYQPPPPTPRLSAGPTKRIRPSKLEDLSHPTLGKPDAVYPYVSASDVLTYATARFSKPEKSFRQAQPDGNGGWRWNKDGIEPLLFHLDKVIEAVALEKTIVIPEGEKDVLRLESLGIAATCNSGGAKKFPASAVAHLTGAHVAILPDNDTPGREHAQVVADLLHGVAASVKVVELAGLPDKGDVSDWLDAGHTHADLLAAIGKAPRWREASAPIPEGRVFVTLAELFENPELLKPPPATIPRICYRGFATLLAAPDKAGKTTFAAHAAVELTKAGQFLGEPVGATTRRVVWVGLEEALGHGVRRFAELGAIAENIKVVVLQTPKLHEEIRTLLAEWPADLLVLDSVTEYARVVKGTVPEDGDTSGWAGVIRPMVHLTRQFPGLSSLLLHHSRRSDGQYRSSSEIAAAVDCLFEMRLPKEGMDPNVRHLTGRARWPIPPLDVRFRDGRYELAGGQELSLDARIIIHVEQNPGISLGKLREHVGGRANLVDKSASELAMRGVLVDMGKGNQHAYHKAALSNQTGMGLDQ